MLLTVTNAAKNRITAHGLNVYPLEGFGVLLGWASDDLRDAYALAALPVGKTPRWYEPEGRFDRVPEAVAVAGKLFRDWALHPVGIYCSVSDDTKGWYDELLASAPRLAQCPWLLLRFLYGRETLFGYGARRWSGDQWLEESLRIVPPRVEAPERNPKRVAGRWNKVWGVLDYGNRHEIELPRLGLTGGSCLQSDPDRR